MIRKVEIIFFTMVSVGMMSCTTLGGVLVRDSYRAEILDDEYDIVGGTILALSPDILDYDTNREYEFANNIVIGVHSQMASSGLHVISSLESLIMPGLLDFIEIVEDSESDDFDMGSIDISDAIRNGLDVLVMDYSVSYRKFGGSYFCQGADLRLNHFVTGETVAYASFRGGEGCSSVFRQLASVLAQEIAQHG